MNRVMIEIGDEVELYDEDSGEPTPAFVESIGLDEDSDDQVIVFSNGLTLVLKVTAI